MKAWWSKHDKTASSFKKGDAFDHIFLRRNDKYRGNFGNIESLLRDFYIYSFMFLCFMFFYL